MIEKKQQLVLASASDRRRELLNQIGLSVEVCPAEIDESVLDAESAQSYVERLAVEKARKVSATYPDKLVIGADTTIEFGDQILGKPASEDDSVRMLGLIQGESHQVNTGVAVTLGSHTRSCVVQTRVRLRPLTEKQIRSYWRTGEPAGKAGSYAIQGLGAMLVERIEGSYSNVVGLPICETALLLTDFGVTLLDIFDSSGLPNSSHE